MKKVFAVLLSLALLVSSGAVAFAAPGSHASTTTVTASDATVYVGDTVSFSAVTLKQGSGYSDSWVGADKSGTSLSGDYYTSTASKKFTTPGTYTITYAITMTAGKSGTSFLASGSVQVEVLAPVVKNVLRYEIRNWTKGAAETNNQGAVIGYYAVGQLWAVYDDGSDTLVNGNFSFVLTRNNDNLKQPGSYDGMTLVLK